MEARSLGLDRGGSTYKVKTSGGRALRANQQAIAVRLVWGGVFIIFGTLYLLFAIFNISLINAGY